MSADDNKPKRVAIIGSGLAGLALAIALEKLPTGVETVKIFERTGQLRPNVGGGLQINGAVSVLSRLGLESELSSTGNRAKLIRSRKADGSALLEVDIPKLFQSTAASRAALMQGNDARQLGIMRDALQAILYRNIPEGTSVEFGKAVDSIAVGSSPSLPSTLRFADGSTEQFDLVVGCDGLKSKVREEIVGVEKPFYSGIKIQFGVGERRPDGGLRKEADTDQVHQWFGEGGYAFTATYGGVDGKKYDQIALISEEPVPAAENENYEEADRRAELIAGLERSGMPADLLLMPEQCQRFFDVGVYFHNPLVPWVKGNLVLAGDAAHAMPPFLGQGANQAVQDAYCLAEAIAAIGSSHPDLSAALRSYQNQRQPPTTRIMLNSWLIGKLETQAGPGAEFRNGVFSVLGKLGIAKQVFLDGALPKV